MACGPQPNGLDLLVVDVDTKHDGMANWAAFVAEHGPFPATAAHRTPSGGLHLFFDTPITGRNGKLLDGVDIRGEGGQVVVPPSWRLVDGAAVQYCELGERSGLHRHPVARIPAIILATLDRPPASIKLSVERHPSNGDQPQSAADWLRDHWDWVGVLTAQGHTVARQSGDDVFMRHPSATAEHSAIVHLRSNMMNAWSTNMPSHPRGLVNRDGSVPWSPFDWFVETLFGGDNRAAVAEINRRRGVSGTRGRIPDPGEVRARAVPASDVDDTPGDDASPGSLNLPPSFWEARPLLAQVRQAAWAAGCSPDALLVQALARVATFVHPCFKLPGVEQGLIGKHQTLDFLGCVVAETSGGKTLAAGVAEMLVPQPDPPGDGSDPLIDFEQKVGSGEGIAEFFLVPELRPDDDGKLKATGKRVIGKQALFMNVDEGTGFTSQAGRKGTTIIATLASAWSGESLGQLNAADETRRLVRGGRVRICAVINMQDSNGYKLYSDELESVGFTGRLMFASAHDPSAPKDAPEWPGRLVWPIRGGSATGNVYFTYATSIVDEIKTTRHGILTGRVQIERRQSQYLLFRCKVAALLAVLDGRLDVSDDDWKLATEAITCSSAVLGHLDAVRSKQVHVTAVTAASFKMEVATEAETVHLRRLAVGWKTRVLDELRNKGPQPWKGLKGLVRADRRAMFRSIVDEMVERRRARPRWRDLQDRALGGTGGPVPPPPNSVSEAPIKKVQSRGGGIRCSLIPVRTPRGDRSPLGPPCYPQPVDNATRHDDPRYIAATSQPHSAPSGPTRNTLHRTPVRASKTPHLTKNRSLSDSPLLRDTYRGGRAPPGWWGGWGHGRLVGVGKPHAADYPVVSKPAIW